MRHEKDVAIFLDSWKEFVRNLIIPNADDFLPFLLKAQSGTSSFVSTAALPSLDYLTRIYINSAAFLKSAAESFKLPENWSNWFNSLAETTVKVAGMRGLTTQLLIEMAQMEICSVPKKIDSFSIDFRFELTSIDLNICRRNQKSDVYDLKESPDKMDNQSGLSNQACLLQVGLQPMTFDVKIVDGNICGVLTGINSAPDRQLAEEEGESEEDAEKKRFKKLIEKTFAIGETSSKTFNYSTPDNSLINLIPINASIIDLDGLVQLVLDVSNNSWEGLRMSLGQLSELKISQLDEEFVLTNSLLLNQFLNTIGSLFAFSAKDGLITLLKSTGKHSAPPIEKYNLKDAMTASLDIKSPNRNLLVGSFKIAFPETSILNQETEPRKTKSVKEAHNLIDITDIPVNVAPALPLKSQGFPETILVNMQWGKINLYLSHKASFLELVIPEGRVALRIHKLSGALTMDDDSEMFSKSLELHFRLFMDFNHMSSVTLRRMVDSLEYWRNDSKDSKNSKDSSKYSKSLKELVQNRYLDMEMRLQPFSLDPYDQPAHSIRSQLKVGPLVHLIFQLNKKIKTWVKSFLKTTSKSKKKSSAAFASLPQISVTPVPLQSSVKLPCIVPSLCTKKQMGLSLSKDLRLLKIKIEIRRAIQSVADSVGHLVGIFVEKLNFSAHPARMNFSIKTSAVAFGFAINGVETLEIEVQPFKIDRVTAVVYSGHKSCFSYSDILKLRQNDNFEFQIVTKLSPAVKNLQQVLSPIILDPDHGLLMAKLPPFHPRNLDESTFKANLHQQEETPKKNKKKKHKIHHIPLVISAQNESSRNSSLLSSLIAFSMPSVNFGPIQIDPEGAAELMKKTKIPKPQIYLKESNEVILTVKINGIVIPNPFPFSLSINHRIGFEIRHKGYTFIRAALDGKDLQIRAFKPTKLSAHVYLSKNAFGKLPPSKSAIFRDFLSDLAFGRPVEFDIAVHIGPKHSMHLPVGLGWREVNTSVFDSDKVTVDMARVNSIVEKVSSNLYSAYQGVSFLSRLVFGSSRSRNSSSTSAFDGLPAANDPNSTSADLLTEIRNQFRKQDAERKKLEQARKNAKKNMKMKQKKKNSSSTDSDSSSSSSSSTKSWKTIHSGNSDSFNSSISSDNSSNTSSNSGSSSSSSNSNSSSSSSNSSSSSSSNSSSSSSSNNSTSTSDSNSSSSSKSTDSSDPSSSNTSESSSSSKSSSSNSSSSSSSSGTYKRYKRSVSSESDNSPSSNPTSENSNDSFVYPVLDIDGINSPPIGSPGNRRRGSLSSNEDTSQFLNSPRRFSPSQYSIISLNSSSRDNDDFDIPTLQSPNSDFLNSSSDESDNSNQPEQQENEEKLTGKLKEPISLISFFSGIFKRQFGFNKKHSNQDDDYCDDSQKNGTESDGYETARSLESVDTFATAPEQIFTPNIEDIEEIVGFPLKSSSTKNIENEDYQSFSEVSESPTSDSSDDLDVERFRRRYNYESLNEIVTVKPFSSTNVNSNSNVPNSNIRSSGSSSSSSSSSDSSSSSSSSSSNSSGSSSSSSNSSSSSSSSNSSTNTSGSSSNSSSSSSGSSSNSSSSSNGSNSSSDGTSSTSSSSFIIRDPDIDDINPIRRTRENQFVRYYKTTSAVSSNRCRKNPPRIFNTNPEADVVDSNDLNPNLVLRELDVNNLKSIPIVDASNFKSIYQMKRSSTSSSSSDSISSSNSSSSNSSDSSNSSSSSSSDSGSSSRSKHKKKSKKQKKNKKNSMNGYFKIQRDNSPAADNPVDSPSLIEQSLFTLTNIANHARVRLFFNNPSDFPIYILGVNMKIVIDDLDMLWSSVILGRVMPYNLMEQEIEARMFMAPQNCRPRKVEEMKGLSHDAFLKCCRDNRSNPVEVIVPNAETEVSTFIYLKNVMSSLQVLDEMLMHDGLCTHVIDSPVSVAVEANNGRPFVIELIANIMDQPGRPIKYGDPCRLETKCEPKNVKFIPIGPVIKSSGGREDLYNPNRPASFFSNASDSGQIWRETKIDLTTDFEISVLLQTTWIYSASTHLPLVSLQPGFGMVFSKTLGVRGNGLYGLDGLSESVAIILNPRAHTINLMKNGESIPFMSKTNGAFPYDMAAHPVIMTVRHRPHSQKLIITVRPQLPGNLDKKAYYFTTVFPVNLGAMLGVLKGGRGDHYTDKKFRYHPGSLCYLGLTGSADNYHQIQYGNWNINSIMPDLQKTQIYFDSKSLASALKPGRFLVQLRDSCGNVVNGLGRTGKSKSSQLKLNVQMKLITSQGKMKKNYDRDELMIEDLSDNDYSIHQQPDTRPSPKPSKPQKHQNRKQQNRKHHRLNSLAFEPDNHWIDFVQVKYLPHYGLFEVNYFAEIAGRYEIYLSVGHFKKQRYNSSSSNSSSSSSSSSSSNSSSSSSSSSNSSSSSSNSSSSSSNSSSSSSNSCSSNTSSSTNTLSTSSSDSSSDSNHYSSDSSLSDYEDIGGPNFKSIAGYRWMRLDTYNLYVPSIW